MNTLIIIKFHFLIINVLKIGGLFGLFYCFSKKKKQWAESLTL